MKTPQQIQRAADVSRALVDNKACVCKEDGKKACRQNLRDHKTIAIILNWALGNATDGFEKKIDLIDSECVKAGYIKPSDFKEEHFTGMLPPLTPLVAGQVMTREQMLERIVILDASIEFPCDCEGIEAIACQAKTERLKVVRDTMKWALGESTELDRGCNEAREVINKDRQSPTPKKKRERSEDPLKVMLASLGLPGFN